MVSASIFPDGDEHPYNTDPQDYVVQIMERIHGHVDCGLTPSKCVVAALQSARPEIQTKRFRMNVLEAIWDDGVYDAFNDQLQRERFLRRLKRWAKQNAPKHIIARCEILETWKNRDSRFIPDAYLIDVKNKTVVCYEVEDSHPLNPWSIGEYGAAWWCLEYLYWDLHLIAYDIYGNWRVINFPYSEFVARHIRAVRKPPPA